MPEANYPVACLPIKSPLKCRQKQHSYYIATRFCASSAEEFRESMLTLYGASEIEVEKKVGFRAWANNIVIGDIALNYAACNSAIALHFPELDYVRQQIGMRGRSATTLSGVKVNVDRGQACTTSLGRPMRVDCEPGHERLTLRIRTEALEKKLASLLGTRPKAALEFEPALDLAKPEARQTNHLLRYVIGLFDTESSEPPPVVLRELEQAIIVSFLAANEHPYSRKLDRAAAGRRASPGSPRRGIHRSASARGASPSRSWWKPPASGARAAPRFPAAPRLHADGIRQAGAPAAGAADALEPRRVGDRGILRLRLPVDRPLRPRLSRGVRRAPVGNDPAIGVMSLRRANSRARPGRSPGRRRLTTPLQTSAASGTLRWSFPPAQCRWPPRCPRRRCR